MWGLSDTSTVCKAIRLDSAANSWRLLSLQLLGVPAWDLSTSHVFQPRAGMTYPLRTDFQVGGWSFGSSKALSSSVVGSCCNSGAFG